MVWSLRKTVVGLAFAWLTAAVGAEPSPKGRVMFWYDTEDYVSPTAHDGTLFHAKLLDEFGFRGNFAIVGFYVRTLLAQGRTDVVAALKPHCLGSQTLYHSRHPTICEYTDIPDWSAAYRLCRKEELECVDILKTTFGRATIPFFVPPGTSVTPVPMYVYADLGVPVYAAGIDIFGDRALDRLVWYANMLQLPYFCWMGRDAKSVPSNDVLANRNLTLLYTHPNEIVVQEWWDDCNFRGKNLTPWGQWRQPKVLPEAVQAKARAGVRAMMSRIKDDPRLTVIDCDDLIRELRPRVAIRRTDVPLLLKKLSADLEPIESPASWCVSDVFQAAVAFLRGAEVFQPDKAWGFLEQPIGIEKPVTLRRTDLANCARRLKTNDFLPAQISVGDKLIGPADFLIAALTALAQDADEVTVAPREQLGPIARHLPNLSSLKLSGSWPIYADDFKDRYVSDRLRWQFWTLRYE